MRKILRLLRRYGDNEMELLKKELDESHRREKIARDIIAEKRAELQKYSKMEGVKNGDSREKYDLL